MDTKTSSRECKTCILKCEPSQIIQNPCNTTHNTECGCKKGEYLHKETFMCTPCSSCKKGFGVKTKCSTNGNTVCQPCPQVSQEQLSFLVIFYLLYTLFNIQVVALFFLNMLHMQISILNVVFGSLSLHSVLSPFFFFCSRIFFFTIVLFLYFCFFLFLFFSLLPFFCPA